MKQNIGKADTIIRIILAFIISGLFFTHTVTGITGTALLVAGGILLVTAVFNFCPLYALLGINSCGIKK
ncbi:DUF2892 domain-containing protein [Parasediminibacterium sp. JCM 36343]|uniref:YgaP family membrane protein n=1 Tax=Parasediminibacterium sp. JCM 36343 TaxID=3374279 RepID=UPI0039784058